MIQNILDAGGADYKPHSTKDDEVWICCPFCIDRGESRDDKYRLGINLFTGLAHCYNCHFKCFGEAETARRLMVAYGLSGSFTAYRDRTVRKKKAQVAVKAAAYSRIARRIRDLPAWLGSCGA